MKYYKIRQKEKVRNVILPQFPSSTEIWSESRPIFVKGSVKKPQEDIVFLPFYSSHTMQIILILNEIRKIWTRYQLGGNYRACALGSTEQRIIKAYWFMKPRILEAIHENTIYYKNSDVEKLYLDRSIIKKNKVFGIRLKNRIELILAEDVLEEIIQQHMTEFQWEEIESC